MQRRHLVRFPSDVLADAVFRCAAAQSPTEPAPPREEEEDATFMRQALELARRGLGRHVLHGLQNA